MSNLMYPDGTNRVVKQRIGEWYAEREGDRTAASLKSKPGRVRAMAGAVHRATADAASLLSAFRLRRLDGPAAPELAAGGPDGAE